MSEQLSAMSEALNASKDGFAIWRVKHNSHNEISGFDLLFINQAGSAPTGREPEALIGHELTDVVGAEQSEGLHKLFELALKDGEPKTEIVKVESPTGWTGLYENTVVPFGTDEVMTTFRDVSEERREHQRLVWLTEHDYLTGMPNRAKLESYLAKCLEVAKHDGSLAAFVYVDIDYFKNVNDTYGHDIGDRLLASFAKRIRHSLPESALVARIAGDEFAIVLEDLRDRAHLADLMDEVFRAMQRPFNHDTPDLTITCSAGAVLTDGSEKTPEVMRFADKVMYQAKYEGRNKYLIDVRLASK